MTTKTRPRGLRRLGTAGVLLVGGGALAVATWVGGDHGLAVGLVVFYVLAAGIAYVWSGRDTDVAAIIGAVINTAVNGDPGGYGVVCFFGGVTYAVAIVVLRRRR